MLREGWCKVPLGGILIMICYIYGYLTRYPVHRLRDLVTLAYFTISSLYRKVKKVPKFIMKKKWGGVYGEIIFSQSASKIKEKIIS